MYATTHGHTGVAITTSSVIALGLHIGLPLGLGLSFISHFLLDYFQEYNYGSLGKMAKAQSYSLAVFIGCLITLYTFGEYFFMITYIFGYLVGNLPDIIDKKIKGIKKERPLEKRFSCHNGNNRIFKYKNFKLGYPTRVQFNKTDQAQMQFVMTVFIIILTVYILK